jgi:alkylhydroperoxidase family enzyme
VAWIRTIREEDARGPLARLYERVLDPLTRRVDNVLSVHSLHPRGLAAHWELYRAAMSPTPGLSAAEREMIAIVVSARNGCHY